MPKIVTFTFIINDDQRWLAPEWLARNLAAHFGTFLVMAKTNIAVRFEDLLAGHSSVVDLSTACSAEICELLEAAQMARRCVKRPIHWADPESAHDFTEGFDEFLALLHRDRRINSQ